MKTLIIGDSHFTPHREIEYVEKLTAIAKTHKPTFIVLLGDTLDSFENVHVLAHNLAEMLLENLSNIAPTFVLIGNHDYINNQQFLSKKHIFGPFKKWKNITIVDTPTFVTIDDKQFVFVPYVPPGRFIEALNVLVSQGENWELADCIFAHQTFKGSKEYGSSMSTTGDVWDEEYPLVISGHIHTAQTVGKNILYPGSSVQHKSNETLKKYVWITEWDVKDETGSEELEEGMPKITKISLGLKEKQSAQYTIEQLLKLESDRKFIKLIKQYDYVIHLTGTSAEIQNFKRSKCYVKFSELNVKFKYEVLNDKIDCTQEGISIKKLLPIEGDGMKHTVCYKKIFKDIIATKDVHTRKEYELLFDQLINTENNGVDCDNTVEQVIEWEFINEPIDITYS